MFVDKKNANQIMKLHSKGAFCEVLSSSFPIGKVQLNFRSYNNQNKVTAGVDIYLDTDKALTLIGEIKSGAFVGKFLEAKRTGKFEGRPLDQYTGYFTNQGGSVRGGDVKSKIFKIQESRRQGYWNLHASEGPGKTTGNGLIQMNGRPTSMINIPISHGDLLALAMKVEMHLQAYTNYVYMRYGERIFTRIDEDGGYTTYFHENPGNYQNNNQANRGYNQAQQGGQAYQGQASSQRGQAYQNQGYQQAPNQAPQQNFQQGQYGANQQQRGNYQNNQAYNPNRRY